MIVSGTDESPDPPCTSSGPRRSRRLHERNDDTGLQQLVYSGRGGCTRDVDGEWRVESSDCLDYSDAGPSHAHGVNWLVPTCQLSAHGPRRPLTYTHTLFQLKSLLPTQPTLRQGRQWCAHCQ